MTQTLDELEAHALDLLEQLNDAKKHQQLKYCYMETAAQGSAGGPYPWQVEFHNASSEFQERAIIAGNRTGKTRSGAADVAIHCTGIYPPWWAGRRLDKASIWVVAGCTNEDVRNVQQQALLGRMVEGDRRPDGTGWIPADCIGTSTFRQCGVPNVLDTVRVKHVTGEYSYIMFKSYEQGAVKFQGFEADGAWLDEEPPLHLDDIFSEIRTRLITRNGMLVFTRTPLFGMSRIVRHFLDGGPGIWWIGATWEDAPHLAEDIKQRYRKTLLDHEVDARTRGVPMLGSGAVYNVPDEQIRCKPFVIPEYYRRLVGVDFGIDHPFAAVWIAYDADNDTVYVTDCYKERSQTASYHAQALKSRGDRIPVSWPHDGMIRDKGGGVALKDQFVQHGCRMLGISARYDDDKGGGQSREPCTIDILDRMRTGRFRVFENLEDWFAEKRLLHRKDGQIVPRDDDLESATRYAVMMLRYAMSDVEAERNAMHPQRADDLDYDPLSSFSHGRPSNGTRLSF